LRLQLIQLAYLIATALFVFALHWMNDPRTARRGVISGVIAMLMAVAGTLIGPGIVNWTWIMGAIVLGFVVGVPLSRVPLTAVPQRTALSHAFGGLAAGLAGTAEYYLWLRESPTHRNVQVCRAYTVSTSQNATEDQRTSTLNGVFGSEMVALSPRRHRKSRKLNGCSEVSMRVKEDCPACSLFSNESLSRADLGGGTCPMVFCNDIWSMRRGPHGVAQRFCRSVKWKLVMNP
jgi:hypothetical protein